MGTKYLSDSEILTVAMNIESDGYRFYNQAGKQAKHKEAREVFERLRDEEARHLSAFKEILSSLPDSGANDYFGISAEIAPYLEALAETGVFKNTDNKTLKDLDETKTLQMAVQAERDSVLLLIRM